MALRLSRSIRPDGSSPYADWFDGLDAQSAAKVTTAKLRMELGNTSNVKWFGGGTKRRQQTDIDRGKVLHSEYKTRKAPPVDRIATKRKR
ncbi:MAG: type II toxin-antitoxin system RelE/ParE family toxin [Proteobacteria bacterium]|nr:type II toxin-antitoxin system RelE/ParE family toxin [Pseudomonadota bacterium]